MSSKPKGAPGGQRRKRQGAQRTRARRKALRSTRRVENGKGTSQDRFADNGERARRSVNVNVGDDEHGDEPPAEECLSSCSSAAVFGGNASKGRNASRGSTGVRVRSIRKDQLGARHRQKRDEPQGRQCAARRTSRQGGESRRSGARPQGRNEDEEWHLHPEGGRPPGDRRAATGSGLPGEQHDGGAIFGQSQERKLGQPG
jgi:hypothetical protein